MAFFEHYCPCPATLLSLPIRQRLRMALYPALFSCKPHLRQNDGCATKSVFLCVWFSVSSIFEHFTFWQVTQSNSGEARSTRSTPSAYKQVCRHICCAFMHLLTRNKRFNQTSPSFESLIVIQLIEMKFMR